MTRAQGGVASYRPPAGSIPTQPGVYRFSDADGRIIYVGKAVNLRSRLSSYFADPTTLHPRTATMVQTATAVDWTVVRTEVEALQLEFSWIKEFDPRFNVKYRDDKSYPWLAISLGEEFPRVYVGRGPKRRGTKYFGPYAHAWAIRETVDALLRVFPMRSCTKGVFHSAQSSGRPCLLGYIDKCAAPCVGRIDADQHRVIAQDFAAFLSGQTTHFLRRLEKQMAQHAEAMEYEQAARARDDLAALTRALEANAIVLGDGTDADVVALAEDPLEVAVQIFHIRAGRVRGQRGWVADRSDDSDTADLVSHFLLQLYGSAAEEDEQLPKEVLVPAVGPDIPALAALLSQRRGAKVDIRVPQRGDKKTLLETVTRNAQETLARHKTRRGGDLTTRNRALEEIAEALELPEAPLRIECFDVSHLQGAEVVASMVVFEDGLPRKAEYRRFVIRGTSVTPTGSEAEPGDGTPAAVVHHDVASMHEVITRRFRRLIDDQMALRAAQHQHQLSAQAEADGHVEPTHDRAGLIDPATGAPRKFAYAPALVVVDGGAPQVAAAHRALTELGISGVALCGLAKRLEEVWLPETDDPVILPRSSEGLYLLQRIRDEAHRFAITHHQGRRSRSMVESLLDDVPGLGEIRRKTLVKHFGSLRKLRSATVTDIAELPGIGERTAQAIVDALTQQPSQAAFNATTGEVIPPDSESSASSGTSPGATRS